MKQATKKFDNLDRGCVIEAVQEHCGVKLNKVGQRDTWLRNESGRTWWVLGGVAEEALRQVRKTECRAFCLNHE